MNKPRVYPKTKLGYNHNLRFYFDTIDVESVIMYALKQLNEKRGLNQRDVAEAWIEATLIELESKGRLKKENE